MLTQDITYRDGAASLRGFLPSARSNETADRRSWQAMRGFLAEAFA